MYYHFHGGITTETNFDLILSSDDECFQIIMLFLVSAQYISSSLKNAINLQKIVLTGKQELRLRICCTLSIDIVNTCFDHRSAN